MRKRLSRKILNLFADETGSAADQRFVNELLDKIDSFQKRNLIMSPKKNIKIILDGAGIPIPEGAKPIDVLADWEVF